MTIPVDDVIVVLVDTPDPIVFESDDNTVKFSVVVEGTPGPPGNDGPPGEGLPIGGTTGQILSKNSDVDLDIGWVTIDAAYVGAATPSDIDTAISDEANDRIAADVVLQDEIDSMVSGSSIIIVSETEPAAPGYNAFWLEVDEDGDVQSVNWLPGSGG